MTNDKALRFFLMLFCMFLLSLIFTAFDMPFSDINAATYDMGFAVGVAFGKMIKVLITITLCYIFYRTMKAGSKLANN